MACAVEDDLIFIIDDVDMVLSVVCTHVVITEETDGDEGICECGEEKSLSRR